MHKDLRLALDAARAARASLPGTERVAELYAGAKGRGLADQDYAAVAAYLASMAPLLEHTPPEGQAGRGRLAMSRGAGAGDRVRLGVIGLGAVAQAVHLPLLATLRDLFEVTAVCDLSDRLAVQVGDRFGLGGAARCRSAEELLDSGRVDAALVLSSGSHGTVAGAALGRGLPVFCEKPLAYTLAEADELARLSGRTGRRCSSAT